MLSGPALCENSNWLDAPKFHIRGVTEMNDILQLKNGLKVDVFLGVHVSVKIVLGFIPDTRPISRHEVDKQLRT